MQNRFTVTGEVTTVDATPSLIPAAAFDPMPVPATLVGGYVRFVVTAIIGATKNTVAWDAVGYFKKDHAGTVTVSALKDIGGAALSFAGPNAGDELAFAGASILLFPTVNGASIQVTGIAATTIQWNVVADWTWGQS